MFKFLSKSFLTVFLIAGFMMACSENDAKPLLVGRINGVAEPVYIMVYYDYDGDIHTDEITTDSTGCFEYNPELPGEQVYASLYMGADVFGVNLQQGKTTDITIDGTKATFAGDNVEVNDFYTACQQAYNYRNFKPTPDHPFDYNIYKDRLAKGTLNARQYLASITDNEKRETLGRLVDAYNHYYTMQIMLLNGERDTDEYKALVDSIDPNADETRISGLINHWYSGIQVPPRIPEQFNFIDSTLVNDANKKSLYRNLVSLFLMLNPDVESINSFIDATKPQLDSAPLLRKELEKAIEKKVKTIKDGDEIPSNPVLIAPDGSKTTLREQLNGKVTYIDLWATWCAPCCREIPFMEEVVERFKGNDKINFISISQDADRDAWLEKLEKDKPTWANFIFDAKSGEEFLDAINCNAIPRFLIIGTDGKFIAIKAARPSDKEIDSILNAAIAE